MYQSLFLCYQIFAKSHTDLRWVLALNLGAPDGVRHRADGEVEQVRVVPLELRVARQTPHQDRVQLLIRCWHSILGHQTVCDIDQMAKLSRCASYRSNSATLSGHD